MKSIKIILITIVIGIFSQSCRKGSMWGIRGKGSDITQTKDISGFNAIQLSISADVAYTQDSVYKVEVTGQENILAIMDIKVQGEELVIDFKRNVWDYNKIKFNIHSPKMVKMNISGSGNVNVQNTINSANLELNISGSGNISISTGSLQSLNTKISGSGNIAISGGSSSYGNYVISGSGNINTKAMSCGTADARISGSGDIVLNAKDKLNVTISGSGNVKYTGRPEITTTISGTGSLVNLN